MQILASIEPQVIGAILGIVASVIAATSSAFFSTFAKKAEDRSEPDRIAVANERSPEPTKEEIQHRDTRLAEAHAELGRQEISARWSGRSATSLAVSQYVVGGTLATSFIQTTFPDWAVGLLGLIVLLASIIYQRFRPDLRMSAARRRVAALKAAIRRAEDDLFRVNQSVEDAPTIIEIRAAVTNALVHVEHSELEENFLPVPAPILPNEDGANKASHPTADSA